MSAKIMTEGKSLHNKSKKVVFFHIKKTGGTSAYRHLYDSVRQGAASPWGAPFEEAKNSDVLGGHYTFEEVSSIDATVICFFRNPISRTISYYNYVKTLNDLELLRNDDASACATYDMDYEEFVNSTNPLVLRESSNHYCKILFGDDYKTEELFIDGSPSQKLLDTLSKIHFIGVKEEFEASVNGMLGFLGLSQAKELYREKDIELLREAASSTESTLGRSDLLAKLKAMNEDDILLYKAAISRRSRLPAPYPSEEIGQFPRLSPGSTVALHGNVKYLQNILFHGWHIPEDGVWSNGASAMLVFQPTVGITNVNLEIEIPEHKNNVAPRISISVNKQEPIVFHAIGSSSSVGLPSVSADHYFVAIPADRRARLNVKVQGLLDALCVLEIKIDQSFVPAQHFDTGDDRTLGFKLHSIQVI